MADMHPDRFQDLADAYGGDIARWPPAEQAAARRFIAAEPQTAARVLAEADALTALLDDWTVAPADATLRSRILASATRPRMRFGRSPLRLWFAGAGLAAALAGVSCGVFLSAAAVREARDEAALAAAFRDPAAAIAPFSEPVQSL